MPRAPRPRYELNATPWEIPTGVMPTGPEGKPAIGWDPGGLRWIEPNDRILDEFVRIARYGPGRFRDTAALDFVATWGAWAACRCGAEHPALGPSVFRAPGMARPPGSGMPRPPGIRPVSDQSVDDLAHAARQVNALRRLAIDARRGGTGAATSWSALWPGQSLEPVMTLDEARATVSAMLEAWLTWAHVAPLVVWNEGEPAVQLSVFGAAGALAVALARELAGPDRAFECEECHTTLVRRGDPDSVWCEPCVNADRQRQKRKGTWKKEIDDA